MQLWCLSLWLAKPVGTRAAADIDSKERKRRRGGGGDSIVVGAQRFFCNVDQP